MCAPASMRDWMWTGQFAFEYGWHFAQRVLIRIVSDSINWFLHRELKDWRGSLHRKSVYHRSWSYFNEWERTWGIRDTQRRLVDSSLLSFARVGNIITSQTQINNASMPAYSIQILQDTSISTEVVVEAAKLFSNQYGVRGIDVKVRLDGGITRGSSLSNPAQRSTVLALIHHIS